MAQTSNGSVSASTQIQIGNPLPDDITLELSPSQLPADGSSTAQLIATVRDEWGNPVANQLVRIGIESDDVVLGSINGQEVVSGYTNSAGQFTAVFTNAGVPGKLGIRAELLIYEGTTPKVTFHDRKIMYIGINFTHLPLVRR